MSVGGDVAYFSMREKSDPNVWNMVSGQVSEGAERVLAWFVDVTSNDRMVQNESGNHDMPRRSVDFPTNSRSKFASGLVFFPTGANHRLVENVQIWDKVENFEGRGGDAFLLAMVPREDFRFPLRPRFRFPDRIEASLPPQVATGITSGMSRGVVVFEKIAPRVTKLTIVQQIDLRGEVPTVVSNRVAVYRLSAVEYLRAALERKDDQVDDEVLHQFVLALEATPPPSNTSRDGVVSSSLRLKAEYSSSASAVELFLLPSERHMVKMEMKVPRHKKGAATPRYREIFRYLGLLGGGGCRLPHGLLQLRKDKDQERKSRAVTLEVPLPVRSNLWNHQDHALAASRPRIRDSDGYPSPCR